MITFEMLNDVKVVLLATELAMATNTELHRNDCKIYKQNVNGTLRNKTEINKRVGDLFFSFL